ncbi:MAG TPA: hypothetical protein DEQ84_00435 [Prevotellaceae bacterium]|nr:hypothetical protein [Prevotellaceae bacterium]
MKLNDECTQWIKQILHIIFYDEGQICFILSTTGITQSFNVSNINGTYIICTHILSGAEIVEFLQSEGFNLTQLDKCNYAVSIEC